MTIRQKFVVAFATVALVVAAVVGVFSYGITARNLRIEADRSLEAAAVTLSAGGTTTVNNATGGALSGAAETGTEGAEGIIQTARTIAPDGSVTAILGGDVGIPVSAADQALAAAGATAGTRLFEDVTVGATSYRVLTQARGGGNGAIQVARDLSETARVLRALAITTALVGLGVLLTAASAGWLVARQITRRLTGLTDVAEQVSSTGHLDVDIPHGGRDEVSRLSTSMQSMLTELARSRADQHRMLQDAGHELRTPLTSLRTNVRVLRRFGELSAASRERLLDDVDGETRELTNLVNELIELAADRRDDEQPEPLDLAALADRTGQRFRRRSGRTITVDAEPGVVTARPHAVERALSNLLDNAIKFDPDGTQPILIRVRGGTIEVLDRGPGLDQQDTDRIFERFYRSATARALPGSGLGLSIVRDVATAHGGTVTAASRPGGGAVIGFTLATDEGAPLSPETPAAEHVSTGATPKEHRLT